MGMSAYGDLAEKYDVLKKRLELAEEQIVRVTVECRSWKKTASELEKVEQERKTALTEEARAEKYQRALQGVIDAVEAGRGPWARAEQAEAEIERLKAIIADQARDESGRVSMPLVAHDKIDAARKERDAALARAEQAEKANAAWRILAERARECLASTAETQERHQAELRRVATEVRERAREIVKLGCGDCSCEGSCVECIDALDLDAIVRGDK